MYRTLSCWMPIFTLSLLRKQIFLLLITIIIILSKYIPRSKVNMLSIDFSISWTTYKAFICQIKFCNTITMNRALLCLIFSQFSIAKTCYLDQLIATCTWNISCQKRVPASTFAYVKPFLGSTYATVLPVSSFFFSLVYLSYSTTCCWMKCYTFRIICSKLIKKSTACVISRRPFANNHSSEIRFFGFHSKLTFLFSLFELPLKR